MDAPFKSSFIPKKSLADETARRKPRSISFFTLLVVVVFFVIVGISIGVVLYRSFLKNSIAGMHADLGRARATFDPTRIEELERFNLRIDTAWERLEAHTAPTLLFELLEANTLVSVQYDNFLYEILEDLTAHVKIDGKARNFSAIALQSDVFGADKNIVSPLFEDLNPDAEGRIDFAVDTTIAGEFLSYGNRIGFGGVETPKPTGGVLESDTTFDTVFPGAEEVPAPVGETTGSNASSN